jgi:UDP-glucose 6-dehydrogenase
VEAAPDITPLIHAARLVNDSQPDFALSVLRKTLGDLHGKTVAVLGLAFKPDVDDLRESPAVEVSHKLRLAGAKVVAFEPFKPDFMHDGIVMGVSLSDTVANADAVLLLVGHTQLRAIDPEELKILTPARTVFDFVNGWNRISFQEAGFKFIRLGDRKNIP